MTDCTEITKRLFFQAKMLTIGMAAAVFIYGTLAYYLVQAGRGVPAALDLRAYPWIQYALLVFSVVGILAMHRLRERILRQEVTPQAGDTRYPQKLFVAAVLMMAAAEMPVFFGLVLVFVGRSFCVFLPFAFLSLAAFYFAFPRKQQWEDWLGTAF